MIETPPKIKRRSFLKAVAGIISVPALGMLPSPAPAASFIPVSVAARWPNPIVLVQGNIWLDCEGTRQYAVMRTYADGTVDRRSGALQPDELLPDIFSMRRQSQ